MKAVVFDLGNVLIAWDPHPAIAAAVGSKRARAFLDDPDFDFPGWNLRQDAGRTWAVAEQEATGTHPHYADEIVAYRHNFGVSLRGPIEGTVAILTELHQAGVVLFGLTNWSAELFGEALDRYPFLGLFADIIVSGYEGVAKPDPEIFAILRRRLRDVGTLAEVVFVDDNPANVRAATQAGIDTIAFTDPTELRSQLRARGLPLTG